jgi:hypothetical protein
MINQRISQGISLCFFYSLFTVFLVQTSIGKFESGSYASIQNAPISIINISISIIGLAFSLSTKMQQLNMAFFWMFQFIFLGITPLLTQLDPYPYYLNTILTRDNMVQATQIILVAQIASLFTQSVTYRKFGDTEKLVPKSGATDVNGLLRRTYKALFSYLLVAPFIISTLGGVEFLFKRVRISVPAADLSVPLNAILLSFLYVTPLVCALTLIFLRSHVYIPNWQIYSLIGWIILLSNPFGNARQTTLFLVIPLFFTLLRKKRLLVIGFFLLLPFLLVYSGSIVNRYNGSLQTPQLLLVSRSGDFDAFSQLANGLKLISLGEFPIFRQVLGSILFFLPRSFWQEKPYDTGVELARLLQLRFQNLSAPWVLEAYVNLRVLGVIFVAILLGFLLTRIDLKVDQSIKFYLLSSMTSGLLFITLRGSLLQATGRAVFTVFFILLLIRNLPGPVRDKVT